MLSKALVRSSSQAPALAAAGSVLLQRASAWGQDSAPVGSKAGPWARREESDESGERRLHSAGEAGPRAKLLVGRAGGEGMDEGSSPRLGCAWRGVPSPPLALGGWPG